MPPVSKGAGGPLPGIDLADSAAIWESEDLATMTRRR